MPIQFIHFKDQSATLLVSCSLLYKELRLRGCNYFKAPPPIYIKMEESSTHKVEGREWEKKIADTMAFFWCIGTTD